MRTIALVGPDPASLGGIAVALRALAQSQLDDRYRMLTVVTYRDGSRRHKVVQALRGFARLSLLAARRDIDLIHVHSASGASFARKLVVVAIARATRRPVLLHVHGGGFPHKLRRSGWRGAVLRRTFRWAAEHADAVAALTPGWADELARWARVERIRVVPNAPDLDERVAASRAAPAAAPTLLFLGHLHADKGIVELVEAFARLRDTHRGLRLVIAGEATRGGSLGPEAIRALAQARGVGGPELELPGWVGPEAKGSLLASAACFVLPSYFEGQPLALLEAMLARVPVVATAVGGIPEVARDGVEALLVPPRDPDALAGAIDRVLTDRRLAERLADAAQRRVRAEYSAAAVARRVQAIYDELLDRASR